MREVSFSKIKQFLEEKNYTSPWIEMTLLDPELFVSVATVQQIPKNEILFHQGCFSETCFIVRSGRFRIYFVDSAGTENCLFIAQKGSLIGELPALDDASNCMGARAIVDSSVYCLYNRDLRNLIYKVPSISIAVLRSLIRKERILTSKVEYFKKNSTERVAISLLSLCIEYGALKADGIRISIRFTHEELANLTGLNRVTVSKIYQTLQNSGIINSKNGLLTILHPGKLMELIRD